MNGTLATTASVPESDGSPSRVLLKNHFAYVRRSLVHGLTYTNAWYANAWNVFSARSHYPANNPGPFFFLLLPLVLPGALKKKLLPLLLISLGAVVVWYWVSLPQVWYILFVFAFMAVVYASMLVELSRTLRTMILTSIMLTLTLMMNTSRLQYVQFLLPQFTSETAMAAQQSESLINYLNSELRRENPSYVILFMSGGVRDAYLVDNHKHNYSESQSFSESDVFVQEFESGELRDIMRAEGITHVYYSASADAYWREYFCPQPTDSRCFRSRVRENLHALEPYVKEVYRDEEGVIYELELNNEGV